MDVNEPLVSYEEYDKNEKFMLKHGARSHSKEINDSIIMEVS
jgi:hypothetical protein